MDQFTSIQRDLDTTKEILQENLQDLLVRDDTLKRLEESTTKTDNTSANFTKVTKEVKKAVWWKTMKCRIFICCILIVAIMIVLFAVCGINFKKCIGDGSSTSVEVNMHNPSASPTGSPPSG
eukprot:TRINITY_DN14913_c0_g1_i3.p1 TRINITY_DN14913_c0_g1~~TRINITY_DN14913_c0_g1_i3.p1  ORF type:complete len:122 (-),score=18.56 TRINITY_DN14913_c0_g1_i3:140-505(-)